MSIDADRTGATTMELELRSELVARAASLVPTLAANAARTESQRRLTGENIAVLEQAGLFGLMRPKRFGGIQAGFRTGLEVTSELARGCGSTAWVVCHLNICSWFAGMWNEGAQQDVWEADPANRVAGVFAPTSSTTITAGGHLVTGSWSWCSGCLHAQWALVGVPLTGAGGDVLDQGMVLIPMSELTIEDTWFAAGMKGTGSSTVVAKEVFVPEHRYLSATKLMAGQTDNPYKHEALYRIPFMAGGTLNVVGPQLGLARAALDLAIQDARERGIALSAYERKADAPTVQVAIAQAASLADSAELLAYRAAETLDDAGARAVFPDRLTRARIRMDAGQAVVSAREAIRILVSAYGASGFAESSAMQRIWRDSEVASRHPSVNPDIGAQAYGQALLGVEASAALV
jgi:3-hydroxy-9,10-secoandrosta-1,3,5(10)-triene-9,17-dione monooxygenase